MKLNYRTKTEIEIALARFTENLEEHGLMLECHTDNFRALILDNKTDSVVGAIFDNGVIEWEGEG